MIHCQFTPLILGQSKIYHDIHRCILHRDVYMHTYLICISITIEDNMTVCGTNIYELVSRVFNRSCIFCARNYSPFQKKRSDPSVRVMTQPALTWLGIFLLSLLALCIDVYVSVGCRAAHPELLTRTAD